MNFEEQHLESSAELSASNNGNNHTNSVVEIPMVASAQQALERRLSMLRRFCLLFSLAAFGGGTGYFILAFALQSLGLGINAVASLIEALVCLIAFWLARSATTMRRADLCSWIITTSLIFTILVAHIVIGAGDIATASFLLIPLAACLLGMSFSAVIINTVFCALAIGLTYVIQFVVKLYQPSLNLGDYPWLGLPLWLLLLTVISVSVLTFVQRLNRAISTAEEQGQLLRNLNTTLNRTTDFGASLSRELSGVTNELNATATQQASGSVQQVAAVTEVTTSLEELSETASQIALSAEATANAANSAVASATEVKQASEVARFSATEGDNAVREVIASVQRVRNRIELLGQRLLYLTEQNRKVSMIIDLIDDIADETHLLALNASIEAAGGIIVASGGAADAGRARYNQGERFGVIAQEIKNLSDRSREATEEVRSAITEMQGAVAAAVLVAEESKKDSSMALSRSQIAGGVIGRLNEVIVNSADSASQILLVVEEVNSRSDEIRLATSQQRSANQQILGTMRMVSDVARFNAGAVSSISGTISRVNEQLAELQEVMSFS